VLHIVVTIKETICLGYSQRYFVMKAIGITYNKNGIFV